MTPIEETTPTGLGVKLWSLALHAIGIAAGIYLGIITFTAITH